MLRALYLGNFVMLGASVWPGILTHRGWANPLEGVGVSAWGALSLLSIVGVRYPLKMLPLVFLQFTYKLIWILAVALPRISTGAPTWYLMPMLMGVIIEPLLIPWPYVFATYIKTPGDAWGTKNRSSISDLQRSVRSKSPTAQPDRELPSIDNADKTSEN